MITARVVTRVDYFVGPHTALEMEMSTIEVSEQLKGSPAEAALKLEASVYGPAAPYTNEQIKAIRPSKLFPCRSCLLLNLFSFIVPMLPGDGGPFGPPEAYHIPFQPITDPVAYVVHRPVLSAG